MELFKNRFHGPFNVAQKLRSANPSKNPSQALEDGLSFQVLGELADLHRKTRIAVAFDGEASSIAFNHQVNSIGAHPPLRCHLEAAGLKLLHDLARKW